MGLKTLARTLPADPPGFREDLQLGLGNRGFQPEQLDGWVNTAIMELVGRKEFEILIEPIVASVVANTNLLVVTQPDPLGPTPLEGIIELSNDTDHILVVRISKARYNLLEPNVQGEPKWWYRQGDEILVWPWPNTDRNFTGQALTPHPVLVDPADTTELLRAYDRAVHLLGMHVALVDLEEPDRATYFLNVSSRYIQDVTDIDEIEGRSTAEAVQPIDTARQLHRQKFVDDMPIL